MVNPVTNYEAPGYAARFGRARKLDGDAGQTWIAALRRAADGRSAAVVLDLGAGVGRFWPILREAWDARCVVAVDRSVAMLRQARPDGTVRSVCADIEDLPFVPRSFDACLCSMVLHYSENPGALCARLFELLRPGGFLCVRTGTQQTIGTFAFLRHFPDAEAAERAAMPSHAEAVAWLTDAGFAQVQVEEVRVLASTTQRSYIRRVLSRGFPSLQSVSRFAFARGAMRFLGCTTLCALRRAPLPLESTLMIRGIA